MQWQLADRSWPELPAERLLIVPLGSTEQHGPHLTFSVDTDIASAVADGVGELCSAVVAPALAFGSSGEHAAFPGTISIGQEALIVVLIEIVRSAGWALRTLFVNGHGGNVPAVEKALRQLREEGHDAAWAPCAAEGAADAHAGRAETSMLLALRPEVVGPERPVGTVEPLSSLLPTLKTVGVRAVSASGVLGDARGASGDEGERLLARIVDRMAQRVARWRPSASGLLLEGS